MTDNFANNKRIAKNTFFLYIRMLLLMAISLYSSRVVLGALGVVDYGIYNVVGGVVAMFVVLNTAMGSSTQRFLTYSLGKGNNDELKTVFSCSCIIHFAIAIIILILVETIGLWFLNNKMVLPAERFDAAFWAFQLSIISVMINVITVPYNSVIVAHERMNAFAVISIIEGLLKLGIVFLLPILKYDKLILYTFLLLVANIIIRLIYRIYCKHNFSETSFVIIKDCKVLKEMSTFSGWTLIGMMAWTFQSQGVNLLLNIFFGPVVNAARGISNQVDSAVMQVVNNFQLATKPQIIKNYVKNEISGMEKLVSYTSLFSAYLLLILFIPIILNLNYILTLWLGKYPESTPAFIKITLIQSLNNVIITPMITATHAVGKMMNPNIYGGLVTLSAFPICYFALKFGATAVTTVIISVIPLIIKGWFDIYFASKYAGFSMRKFIKNIYIKVLIVGAIMFVIPYFTLHLLNLSLIQNLFYISFESLMVSILAIWFMGINSNHRQSVRNFLKTKLKISRKVNPENGTNIK